MTKCDWVSNRLCELLKETSVQNKLRERVKELQQLDELLSDSVIVSTGRRRGRPSLPYPRICRACGIPKSKEEFANGGQHKKSVCIPCNRQRMNSRYQPATSESNHEQN